MAHISAFPTNFARLGSAIDFLMVYSEDAKNHVRKAFKHLDALKFISDDFNVPIDTKIKLFTTILLNLLLWC